MWWMKRVATNLLGYKVDPDELDAYRSVIPSEVNVNIKKIDDLQVATIKEIDGKKVQGLLITEAPSDKELLLMVNDLVLTYKDVPERIRPYFKQVLKPEGTTRLSKELTLVKA